MSSSSRDHAPTDSAVTSGQLDMVERVARALHRAHHEGGRRLYPNGAWDFLDRFERERWLFSARAAIEAMREPTEAMLWASTGQIEAEANWKAMVDAAIQSAPPIDP